MLWHSPRGCRTAKDVGNLHTNVPSGTSNISYATGKVMHLPLPVMLPTYRFALLCHGQVVAVLALVLDGSHTASLLPKFGHSMPNAGKYMHFAVQNTRKTRLCHIFATYLFAILNIRVNALFCYLMGVKESPGEPTACLLGARIRSLRSFHRTDEGLWP